MNVIIDEEACIGCGSCVEVCPDVFRMNEDKEKAEIVTVQEDSEECIEEAIDTCPVSCIHWDE
jgi:ferredoxin